MAQSMAMHGVHGSRSGGGDLVLEVRPVSHQQARYPLARLLQDTLDQAAEHLDENMKKKG